MELSEWWSRLAPLAETIIQLEGVFVYCALIIVSGAIFWLRLEWKTFKLKKTISNARQEIIKLDGIHGFHNGFEEYSIIVRGIPQLKPLWREFEETLELPKPGAAPKIQNPVDVSHFFNQTTLVERHINVGWYQGLPNLLTGMGILGTFIGLTAGVFVAQNGLASGNPEVMLGSLQQLLAGAALAFCTSITGLGCSMLFRSREAPIWRNLTKTVDDWVEAIDERLVRVTPESIGLEHLQQAKEATGELKTFNTELIYALEQALEEKIASRISEGLDSLTAVVQDLRSDRQTDANKMVSHAIGELSESLKGQTESQFKEMATVISSLNQTLRQSTENLSSSQSNMQAVLDNVLQTTSRAMENRTSAMTEAMLQSMNEMRQTVADSVRTQAEHIATTTNVIADQLGSRVAQVAEELSQAGVNAALEVSQSTGSLRVAAESLSVAAERSKAMLSGMTSFTDQLNQLRSTILSAQRQILEVSTPLQEAALTIRESSAASTRSVEITQELAGNMAAAVESLSERQDRIADVWRQYKDRFEGIDQALATTFSQLDEGLTKYCDQVTRFVTELDNTTAKTVGQLAGANSELNQSIEDLTDALSNGNTWQGPAKNR